jgi:hypothetical protein
VVEKREPLKRLSQQTPLIQLPSLGFLIPDVGFDFFIFPYRRDIVASRTEILSHKFPLPSSIISSITYRALPFDKTYYPRHRVFGRNCYVHVDMVYMLHGLPIFETLSDSQVYEIFLPNICE